MEERKNDPAFEAPRYPFEIFLQDMDLSALADSFFGVAPSLQTCHIGLYGRRFWRRIVEQHRADVAMEQNDV